MPWRSAATMMVNFGTLPVWVNVTLFAGGGAVVWMAGTRLARYADAIGDRTGLSKAFLGLVLLGVATSLPEIATTITGAIIGNARLVAGNLLGGVALQVTILAIVDLVAVRGALTYFTPQPVLLFQGVMLLLLLAITMAGAVAGEPLALGSIGLTPVVLLGGYLMTLRASNGGEYLPRWKATNEPSNGLTAREPADSPLTMSNSRLYAYVALAGLAVLGAGWLLATVGDVLATQTQLGASFVGVSLVAASTSLPELSTSLAAVRQGNPQMAVSNILGTNCLEMALFLLGDVLYRAGPILGATDRSALFAGSLGMVVTAMYLLGLLERRDRTVARMGIDSACVVGTYALGLVGLYFLR
jgi:cation:H+ antiporter